MSIKEINSIDDLNVDSNIMFFAGLKKEKSYTDDPEEISNAMIFDYFVFTSKLKKTVFSRIGKALAEELVEPFTVMVPKSMFEKTPKNFIYPIMFYNHRVYIVPYIREILVYEFE